VRRWGGGVSRRLGGGDPGRSGRGSQLEEEIHLGWRKLKAFRANVKDENSTVSKP